MLYLNWAEVTRKVAGKAEAILVLQKGVHNHAEPVHSLLTSIDELIQVY